jgi:radical SAM-linked protein
MSDNTYFRYRIVYAKTSVIRFTSHLDILRMWERTFRRAQLPLAFTQGFNPRPRINLGLALPLGFTSECELMDIWLVEEMEVNSLLRSILDALPPGLEIQDVFQIDQHSPPLQKQIHEAIYSVHLDPFPASKNLQRLIDALLTSTEILRERRGKTYDLRSLINSLEYVKSQGEPAIVMRLSAQDGRTGRPDEVLLQLDLDPSTAQIHRKKITLTNPTTIRIESS